MLRFYLRIKKEDTERKNRRKGKEGYKKNPTFCKNKNIFSQ